MSICVSIRPHPGFATFALRLCYSYELSIAIAWFVLLLNLKSRSVVLNKRWVAFLARGVGVVEACPRSRGRKRTNAGCRMNKLDNTTTACRSPITLSSTTLRKRVDGDEFLGCMSISNVVDRAARYKDDGRHFRIRRVALFFFHFSMRQKLWRDNTRKRWTLSSLYKS
jgi:hypothetical protein